MSNILSSTPELGPQLPRPFTERFTDVTSGVNTLYFSIGPGLASLSADGEQVTVDQTPYQASAPAVPQQGDRPLATVTELFPGTTTPSPDSVGTEPDLAEEAPEMGTVTPLYPTAMSDEAQKVAGISEGQAAVKKALAA